MVTSEATHNKQEWPFVTLSAFEIYFEHTSAHSIAESMMICLFVDKEEADQWANYSVAEQGWIHDGLDLHNASNLSVDPVIPYIHYFEMDDEGKKMRHKDDGTCCDGAYPMMPLWQIAPTPLVTEVINYNLMRSEEYRTIYDEVMSARGPVMGPVGVNPLTFAITNAPEVDENEHFAQDVNSFEDEFGDDDGTGHSQRNELEGAVSELPHSPLVYPIFREPQNSESDIVGLVFAILPWDSYVKKVLPEGVEGLYCVLSNTCGQAYTFDIDGPRVNYLGKGDLHQIEYTNYQVDLPLSYSGKHGAVPGNEGSCVYKLSFYPSSEFRARYKSNVPIAFAVLVGVAFSVVAATFFVYDWFVVRKNNKIIDAAAHSSAIVSSLFPSTVRDRLLNNDTEHTNGVSYKEETGKAKLKSFLNSADGGAAAAAEMNHLSDHNFFQTKPIADLFPETTIMFGDLVGFTAWSSVRQPTQVFMLLETIYCAFDRIAKRRRVFKVETVGDCYVAVTGLPEARKDHAVVMARFAHECL
jgi:Adenylate and Guanylate cyclase catalytic domain